MTDDWNRSDIDRLTTAGHHLLPASADKKPMVKWRHGNKDYVEVAPTSAEIDTWCRKRPKPAGWLSVCGRTTGLVVLDVEAAGVSDTGTAGARIAEVLGRLPETCKRQTPSGGVHAWVNIADGDVPDGRECRLVQKTISTDETGRPTMRLLAEYRGHGQYALILGHGRGALPQNFAPATMTRPEWDLLVVEPLREVSDTRPVRRTLGCRTTKPLERAHGVRDWTAQPPVDTPDVLAWGICEGHLTWLELLDEDWTEVGTDSSGWSHWLRPDYGNATTAASSAHGSEVLGVPSLVLWSSSVPWGEVGIGLSPAEVLVASGRLGNGGFAQTMMKIERAARTRSRIIDWPPEVWKMVAVVAATNVDGRTRLEIANTADFKDQMVELIGTGPTAGLFSRDGLMVHVPQIGEDGYSPPKDGMDGPAQVRQVSATLLAHVVEDAYWLYTVSKDHDGDETEEHRMMPAGVAPRLVEAAHLLPGLSRLNGVVHTPLLRPDGSLLKTPGYDAETRLLYLPDAGEIRVPEQPTATEIELARELLRTIVGEFPWVHPGDYANYLGALVLPFLRLLIPPPWPMWLLNAHQPGSGKTMLSKIVRAVHGGAQRSVLPADDDEVRKQIMSLLTTTAGQVVVWDNVVGVVKSAELANLLTSRHRTDRRLGESIDVTVTNDRLFMLTGNNIAIGGDLPRRCVWVSIDPQMPNPENRTDFTLPDPDVWVRQHLAEVRAALLTLLGAWVDAGMPRNPVTRTDDYGQLAAAVGELVPFLDPQAGAFMAPETVLATVAVDDEDWAEFLAALHQRHDDRAFTSAEVIRAIDGYGEDESLIDYMPEDLRIRHERGSLTAKSLGNYFRNRDGRWHGRYAIRRAGQDRKASVLWRVESAAVVTASPSIPYGSESAGSAGSDQTGTANDVPEVDNAVNVSTESPRPGTNGPGRPGQAGMPVPRRFGRLVSEE